MFSFSKKHVNFYKNENLLKYHIIQTHQISSPVKLCLSVSMRFNSLVQLSMLNILGVQKSSLLISKTGRKNGRVTLRRKKMHHFIDILVMHGFPNFSESHEINSKSILETMLENPFIFESIGLCTDIVNNLSSISIKGFLKSSSLQKISFFVNTWRSLCVPMRKFIDERPNTPQSKL